MYNHPKYVIDGIELLSKDKAKNMALIEFKNDKTTPLSPDNLNHNFNELNEKMGDLSALKTDDKSNLVSAINSLVIEEADNEYGHYIKFQNGILICVSEFEKAIDINASLGNGFYNGITFSNNMPCEFAEIFYDDLNVINEYEIWATQYYSSSSKTWSSRIDFFSFVKRENISVKIRYFAIGKWKA